MSPGPPVLLLLMPSLRTRVTFTSLLPCFFFYFLKYTMYLSQNSTFWHQSEAVGVYYSLCGRDGGYMTKFKRWSEKERHYVLRYMSKLPPSNSITCKKDTPDHIPKWKNTQDITTPTQVVHTCIHPGCKATSQQNKLMQTSASRDSLKRVIIATNNIRRTMWHVQETLSWIL